MRPLVLIALMLVAACGQSGEMTQSAEDLKTYSVSDEARAPGAEPSPGTSANRPGEPAQATAAPQIAYTYSFGYRVDAGAVAAVQRRHVALCDTLGAARCRIVSMTRDSGDGHFVRAALSLLVEARIARAFGDRLDGVVTGSGGDVSARGIEAEDLSKQIVDTEARLRGKQALAERLLALLGSQGNVGELVEAERAYAQAQEELDAARSWLAEMRGRVSMSKLDISYESEAPEGGGMWRPVRSSIAEAGQVFGASIAALITLTLALLPWALMMWLLLWLFRRLGWLKRLRVPWFRRRASAAEAAPEPSENRPA